mmetsp:Transcript_19855/g.29461  ORF Transcript_19855/g.29461 Transcript_19855/m.29461 type:complete len:164 (+) Transcript_19855:710-1201(+)
MSDKMEPNLNWIQKRLNFLHAQTRKIIINHPNILYSSIEDNMEPKLKWLQRRLFWENNNELSNIIQKMPTLLGCSVQSNLEPTLDFYMEMIGDENFAITTLKHNPLLFTYSLEKRLKPRLKEAKAMGLNITKNSLTPITKYSELRWISFLEAIDEKKSKDRPE